MSIDDGALLAARSQAERERKSVGEVRSALARQGLRRSEAPSVALRSGIPLLPRQPGATSATLELVNQLRDEAP
ncbi:MAG: CopG family transcriptional regulator [Aquabacterium sp.]|nr:CopG family transcriptional regulator [Aquabacterium sp.]